MTWSPRSRFAKKTPLSAWLFDSLPPLVKSASRRLRRHDLVCLAAEERRHLTAGSFHRSLRGRAGPVRARRVPEVVRQEQPHRLDDLRRD